jgi:glycogen(starch) synthase
VTPVSVVICTYNRAEGLRATLDALHQQRYPAFEVVVVNGPSSDHTNEVCRERGPFVRVVDNPVANLSVSRNLGIRAAAGEVVAFLDDDALPEPAWLEQAMPWFENPEVAGVGGIVVDHNGMTLQYRYSAANRLGKPEFSDLEPYDKLCVPGAHTFPYLQGTNALFRRAALAEIGLFDETFDFYLDETDVCLRLVDAGFELRQIDAAPVHHKYLPSDRRSERKVVTNWYSIVRNHVYFGFRHALGEAPELDVMRDAVRFADYAVGDAWYHEEMGAAPPGHTAATAAAAGKAIVAGVALGRERASLRLAPADLDAGQHFPYPIGDPADRLRVVFVSAGYPPSFAGGIGRFIGDVAPEFARRGHEVRVITRTDDVPRVDRERGVWVHRIALTETPGLVPDGPAHVDGFATAVVDELRRIQNWWTADVAYGSLWDVELLGVARAMPDLPVVPILATPVAEVARHEGWALADHPLHDTYVALVRLERELVARSAVVHGISDAIVASFDDLYPGALRRDRLAIAHIGRADDGRPAATSQRERPMVLFVGRLEPRKGIDTFLAAAARIANEEDSIDFVVAGDDSRLSPGGETYAALWARLAGPNAGRLEFVGAVSDDALGRLITDARVVTMPSRYESFGLVVVEAMMHGRAAVASDVGGIAELIDHGRTGVLVPVGDADALAEAIPDIARDASRAAAIGKAARAEFERHFDIVIAAERLEHILRSVARSRRPEIVEAV